MRRVVISGLGIVSCLGNNQEEVHQSLLNSKSGISYAEEYKEHNLKSHIHGKPNIKLSDFVDRKTIRFMGSGSAYNYIAMKEAIESANIGQIITVGDVCTNAAIEIGLIPDIALVDGLTKRKKVDYSFDNVPFEEKNTLSKSRRNDYK